MKLGNIRYPKRKVYGLFPKVGLIISWSAMSMCWDLAWIRPRWIFGGLSTAKNVISIILERFSCLSPILKKKRGLRLTGSGYK